MGSASLGWFLSEDGKVIKKGVVTFDTGMSKGQSGGYTSPTRERREARSKRNLIRARKYRKWELLKVLAEEFAPLTNRELEVWCKYKKGQVQKFPENENFLKWLACDFTYENGVKYKNPYELRVKGLDSKLSKHEFGRVLYHLVQRRGYKDIGENDKETEKQIDRRKEGGFQKALNESRTIAEALSIAFLDKGERARNQYPYRDEYKAELELICKGQGYIISKDRDGKYTDEFIQKLWKAIIWQRPLRTQKGNIGKCTLEPSKPRCPVSHPVFEIFRAWSFINTIKYYDENNEKVFLEVEKRKALFSFFLKKDKNFKFEDIRNFLDKQFGKKKKYNYPIDTKTGKYDTSVSGMPICKGLIDIFGEKASQSIGSIENYNIGTAHKILEKYSVYDFWHALFSFDEQYLEKLSIEKLGIPNVTRKRKNEEISISPLVELKSKVLQGYSDLSLKAMVKIIPFLKEGYLYNEAVVLAKIPELLGDKWKKRKDDILKTLKQSNSIYNSNKITVGIANNLIDIHKGKVNAWKEGKEDSIYAYKDNSYVLEVSDIEDIRKACKGFFGDKTWENKTSEEKEEILQNVGHEYQDYFYDETRAYRKLPTLTDIFKDLLNEKQIILNGELYHHSNRENIYNKTLNVNFKTGEKNLPKYRDTQIEILPVPYIDSIKNPMFNKSMNILRKLVNELIINGDIDEETEVVIELARELNDNNKRAAIERYQNERKNKREKYREFLKEFNQKENRNINVEKSMSIFELWTEQTFEEAEDEKGLEIKNEKNSDILKEKDALRRYELWMEQKGQCMYTGKMISISQLFSNEIDIEHTIPRSLLPDNTMANQTVAYSKYNRDIKEARTPFYCENFSKDTPNGTSIQPRLDYWMQTRDNWKKLYESRLKPTGNEDENAKNKRIQEKHYFRMHYDYWKDKLERFEAEEIKDSWARRQLVDTQMVSKYAREFLKLYFRKVAVQKGTVTADFRKIYGFQEEDEIKSRNRHTHHAIDAAVLTLIPSNSSHRERILKDYYEALENNNKSKIQKIRETEIPSDFSAQDWIKNIEDTTLIVNYKKDKILQQTGKTVRKRGKIQYVKNKQGDFVLNEKGERIVKKAKGDTVRSSLFAQTYLGKIKDVERYDDGQARRENGDWKYKTGKDEFAFVVRKPIKDVLSKIDDIVDPGIRELVRKQKKEDVIKDYQGNTIRHVRIRTSSGKEVKERINFRSKYEYKNKFYSTAGSLPYAILFEKSGRNNVERKMFPIASFEIANVFKLNKKFDIEDFVSKNYPEYNSFNKTLLKAGQKVLVLNDDNDFEKRFDNDFQRNRLYEITQFKYDGSKILLKYHLEAQSKSDIDSEIKAIKSDILEKQETILNISKIKENNDITDAKERKTDFEKRLYDFASRLKKIEKLSNTDVAKNLKIKIEQYKTESSVIIIEGQTPILGLTKNNWNLLIENRDFKMSVLGEIRWIENDVFN